MHRFASPLLTVAYALEIVNQYNQRTLNFSQVLIYVFVKLGKTMPAFSEYFQCYVTVGFVRQLDHQQARAF